MHYTCNDCTDLSHDLKILHDAIIMFIDGMRTSNTFTCQHNRFGFSVVGHVMSRDSNVSLRLTVAPEVHGYR